MTHEETYGKAMELFQKRQFEAAEGLLLSLTEEHPELCLVWQLRSGVAFEQGNFDRSAQYMQRALELLSEDDPSRPGYLANYGVLLFRAERYEEAEQPLKDAVAKAPGMTNAMGTLILCLRKVGKPDEAIRFANELVSLSPLDGDRWALLAECEAELGNYSVYARGIAAFQINALPDAVRYLSHTAAAAPDDVRYAFDECAAATQFGRWHGKDAELPELLSRFEGRATPATAGVYRLFASAALFRATSIAEADRVLEQAKKAMVTAGNWDDVRFPDEEACARLDSRLNMPEVPEKSAPDPYADDAQAEAAYVDARRLAEGRYPFVHEAAIASRMLYGLLRGLLTEKSGVKAVTQLGVSCAGIFHTVAIEFPDIHFSGVDRSAKFKALNEQEFPGDNIGYAAGDYLGFMKATPAVENGLLLHTQTLAAEYPDVVREIYRLARKKGYRYIALLEPAGFDRRRPHYPKFGTGFQSFVCRDQWMVHDYTAMLIQAWYKIEHTVLYPTVCGLGSLAQADRHLIHALAVLPEGKSQS